MTISYHDKHFRSVSNSATGEVDAQTSFHYRQEGDIIWATYRGGKVRFGTLCGRVNAGGRLEFTYQHLNTEGEFMTGRCRSVPEVLKDGRLRLHERWQWTCKDHSSGESLIEEVMVEGWKGPVKKRR